MLIRNRRTSLLYKIVLAAVSLLGLLLNLGFISGGFAPYGLFYYTVFCNLLCLVFYIAAAAATAASIRRTGTFGVVRFAPHFKGAVVVSMFSCIILTVYLFAAASFAGGGFWPVLSNSIAGVIVPAMVLADWIVFDRKGRFFGVDPVIWTVVFFVWYCLVLIAAQLGLEYYGGYSYPYDFIDPDRITWAPVLVYVFIAALSHLVLGLILFGADRLWDARAKRRAMAEREAARQNAAGSETADNLESLENLLSRQAAPLDAVGPAQGQDPAVTAGAAVAAPVQAAAGERRAEEAQQPAAGAAQAQRPTVMGTGSPTRRPDAAGEARTAPVHPAAGAANPAQAHHSAPPVSAK